MQSSITAYRKITLPWGNEDTQQLIDILGQYNVPATFFVVGEWVDKYPESVKALTAWKKTAPQRIPSFSPLSGLVGTDAGSPTGEP